MSSASNSAVHLDVVQPRARGLAAASPAARAGSLVGAGARSRGDDAPATAASPERSQWAVVLERFREHRAGWWSLWVVAALTAACVVVPVVLPWSATEVDYDILTATAPSASHPLGTDPLGRDVLARLLSAGRVSLLIGLVVAVASAALGAFVGTVAGFVGGRTDELLMWGVNILLTIPSLPLLIALSTVAMSESGRAAELFAAVPPTWRIIVVMSLLGWMAISRVVRTQVRSLREREFVEASIALGASPQRVMVVHILPNTISVLSVFTTLTVSTAIMSESSLSFLGLGVPLPTATWGNMLLEARDVFTAMEYWWLTWSPAVCILVTVLCVNFMGDALRDAFDPRTRR